MILIKTVLLLVLAVLPMVPVVFALPWVSTITTVALVGFWLLDPSWGSWLYVGICLNLIQWRAWQLHVKKLRMSVYVSSPTMGIQNGSSVELAIGGGIGAVRSLVGGDFVGTGLGVVVALLLFGLQGILFPNPSVILQACGDPFVSSEELLPLLEKADYPTILRFNRHARKVGILGPLLPVELGKVLDEKQGRGPR